jgi:hypothetical protein
MPNSELLFVFQVYVISGADYLLQRIPNAYPDGEEGDVRIKVISGKSFGVESPVRPLGELLH